MYPYNYPKSGRSTRMLQAALQYRAEGSAVIVCTGPNPELPVQLAEECVAAGVQFRAIMDPSFYAQWAKEGNNKVLFDHRFLYDLFRPALELMHEFDEVIAPPVPLSRRDAAESFAAYAKDVGLPLGKRQGEEAFLRSTYTKAAWEAYYRGIRHAERAYLKQAVPQVRPNDSKQEPADVLFALCDLLMPELRTLI